MAKPFWNLKEKDFPFLNATFWGKSVGSWGRERIWPDLSIPKINLQIFSI